MGESFGAGLAFLILMCLVPGLCAYFIHKQRSSVDDYEGRYNLVKCCNVLLVYQLTLLAVVLFASLYIGEASSDAVANAKKKGKVTKDESKIIGEFGKLLEAMLGVILGAFGANIGIAAWWRCSAQNFADEKKVEFNKEA